MQGFKYLALFVGLLLFTGSAQSQDRAKSPRGKASTQVGTAWIDIDYGRPILRGRRAIFGENQDDQSVYAGAPVWRFGANTSTRLRTEAPLIIGGSEVAPGEYSLFVDIGSEGWELIVSGHDAQKQYGQGDGIWGSYGYDASNDVARVQMNLATTDFSVDQFTLGFVDVTDSGGSIAMWWDNTMARAPFTVKN